MIDTSLELREQSLPEHANRSSGLVRECVTTRPTQGQYADSVASHQDLPLNSQPFTGFKIPEWPDNPLPLTQTCTTRFLSIALDIALLLVSLLFLALAIGALAVNGRSVGDESGRLIEQTSRLGPTVFPIIFAALVGRALKTIGRLKSEKGIQVSVSSATKIKPPNTTLYTNQ